MNYPFRNAIIDFVTGRDNGVGFERTVMTIAESYPKEVVSCLMNSLSTHDTPRALSLLSGVTPPESKEERAVFRLSGEELRQAEARLKCAAFLQFVLPGMPCIYYGDEIGTEGFEDPFCRTFFDWQRAESSKLKKFYQKLADLRNKSDVLKYGDVYVECIGDGEICIVRKYKNKSLTAYINCKTLRFKFIK